MATIYVNNVSSSSTSLTNGQRLDQSSTYTITIENNYSQTLNASVYFYNSTGMFDWDSSYNGETISTYSLFTAKGWMGPYKQTVSAGTAEFGDSGPDSYGYLSAVKAIFTNVPSTVSAIGVDFYDGSSWSDRYYWSLKKPAELTNPGTPTVSYANNTFSLSWGAASGSNGSGNVTYRVIYGDSTNGSTAFSTDWSTSTSASIARWINPTRENITYSFYIQAKYSEITRASSTITYTLTAPSIAWSNKTLTVSQVNNQLKVSWNAASINNNYSNESLIYSVVCTTRAQSYGGPWYGTDISATSITFNPPAYDEELFIQVTAWANNVGGSQYSTGVYVTAHSPTVSAPGKPSVSLSGDTFTVSWASSSGQYGAAGSTVQYSVSYADSVSWSSKQTSKTSATSITIPKWISVTTSDIDCMFNVNAYYSTATSYSTTTTYTLKAPTLTAPGKPTVTHSDNVFKLSWSAAVGNYGSGSVTYQITYGDSVNGYNVYTSTSTSATSISIPRWLNPTWDDVTYNFSVIASYSGITTSSGSAMFTLAAPSVTWTNKALNVTQQGDQVFISWSPASIINNYSSEVVWYSIQCTINGVGFVDGQYFGADTTDTSILFTPPAYDKELFVQLNAWAHNVSGGVYSDSATFIITSAPEHYTIKCFIDGEWKECIIKYYDGQNWIDSIAKYFDGAQWIECSF